MLPEFIHNLKQIVFTIQKIAGKQKTVLPGAENSVFIRRNEDIRVHQYSKPAFSIRYVLLNMFTKASLSIREKEPGIRLEAVLTGELTDTTDKEQIQIIR